MRALRADLQVRRGTFGELHTRRDSPSTTNDSGGYDTEELEAGEYTVTVSHDDYESDSRTVEVDGDVAGVDFVLRAHGSISGTVTDTDDEGIADATVEVLDTEHNTTTDDAGEYTIEDVEAGEYTVTASHDDVGSDSQTVEVDGDVDGVDFELTEPTHNHEADNVPWGVERTGAAELHGEHTGDGVSVYVIDTGIDATHDDLEPNLGGDHHSVVECHKTRGETCEADWDDDHGHGTWVAGTVGATDADQMVGMRRRSPCTP